MLLTHVCAACPTLEVRILLQGWWDFLTVDCKVDYKVDLDLSSRPGHCVRRAARCKDFQFALDLAGACPRRASNFGCLGPGGLVLIEFGY